VLVFVLGDALGLWKEQNHMTGMSISALENGGINVFLKKVSSLSHFCNKRIELCIYKVP